MNFIDKTIILKDEEGNNVCIFVDKVAFIKEVERNGEKAALVGLMDGWAHTFIGEDICSFLRKINMGCEWCDCK